VREGPFAPVGGEGEVQQAREVVVKRQQLDARGLQPRPGEVILEAHPDVEVRDEHLRVFQRQALAAADGPAQQWVQRPDLLGSQA
jgi:hypothetical protein